MARVLIVDDDRAQRKIMRSILSEEGHQISEAGEVDAAAECLRTRQFSVIVTDLKMPGKSGLDLVEIVAASAPVPEIIVITAFGSVDTAVRAMKMGAYDYLTKPIEHDKLILVVQRAAEKHQLRLAALRLQDELIGRTHQEIIADSASMKTLLETARRIAQSDSTVLLRGESGTGKDRIARLIHYSSKRKDRPLQCINCASFPDTLLESELFGYEKGAFTGAQSQKTGILEAAEGGTVFLDEVADMSLPLQAKILRVLQEKEIRKLGGVSALTIDVRFIAATNRRLEDCVSNGTFREDLFYRLHVIPLIIPPLRERPEDIPGLVELFLSRRSIKRKVDRTAIELLQHYSWPGNVRELEAIMERISVLCPHDTITPLDLPPEIRSQVPGEFAGGPSLPRSGIVFEQWERSMLEQALRQSEGVMSEAAKLLGMTYRTFQYRAEKFGLGKASQGDENVHNTPQMG